MAKPYAEWLAEKNNHPTWRTAIRQDVDEAIQQSLTWRQFLTVLDRKGYEVRMGRKYPVLRPPGKERFVRFKTLGKRYTPEAIQTRILYPRSYRPYVENPPTIQHGRLRSGKPRRKLTGLRALYYDCLSAAVRKAYDLTPAGIIKQLNLLNPIYSRTAAGGHFGREDFPWENVEHMSDLAAYIV